MTRYYFVRHGTTDCNRDGIYFGMTDCPLNEEGILQSEKLSTLLSSVHFDEIFTSPMKRCTDTARVITPLKKPKVSEALLEMDFGLWEGMHYKECMEKYSEEFRKWSLDYKSYAPPQGEKYSDFHERVSVFYHDQLIKENGNILIVSHKGVLQLLTSFFLTGDDSLFWNFSFLTGKYSILEIESGHCTIKRLNL